MSAQVSLSTGSIGQRIERGGVSGVGGAINNANGTAIDSMTMLAEAAAGNLTGDLSIMGCQVLINGELQAGSLVELQFKLDQIMAAVQMAIKNAGKVSQTREAAARA